MSDTGQRNRHLKTAAKVLAGVILAALCCVLLIVVGIRIYLATSRPAPQLSRLVTSQLRQTFTVQSVGSSGNDIVLKGLRLENPPGFPQGPLAAADTVTVAPQWFNFLRGGQRFRLISLQGVTINLVKNSSGVWNYSNLERQLAARKPSAKETFIEELRIKDGSLKVQGEGVQGVSLQVFNLASKGSLDSRLDLAFEDGAHNRYAIRGKGRGGADAALDLTLTAPSLSLKQTAVLLKMKNPSLFEGGKGSLQLNATLHKGEVNTVGDLSFSGMRLPPPSRFPVRGALHFAADYDMAGDSARLKESYLTVDKLVKLRAGGQAKSLKRERQFSLHVAMEDVDLGTLNLLVPELARRHLSVAGRLRCDAFDLEGDRSHGLRRATGVLALREGALTREGRLLAAGLAGTATFSRQQGAIQAKGRLSGSGQHGSALLQALDTPFAMTMSPKLKPLKAELSPFSATVMGIPATGRAAFDVGKASPISASIKAPAVKLSALNDELKRYGLRADSGGASVAVEVAGKTAQDFGATARVELLDVRGARGKNSFALKKGSSFVEVQRRGGRLLARGNANLAALELDGKKGDARLNFRVADGMIYLDQVRADAGGVEVSIARIEGPIPARQASGAATRYPIALDFEGVTLKRGDVEAGELSGRVRGSFYSDSAGRWLDGTADIRSAAVAVKGKKVAAPILHAVFTRPGGKADVSGELLGGKLTGSVAFNPFDTGAAQKFDLELAGAALTAAVPFLPKGTLYQPSAGSVDIKANGSYSGRDGLSCRFDTKGKGIALAAAGGKTLVSGAGLAVAGSLAGGNLAITEGEISPGPGVALRLKGEVAKAFDQNRKGNILLSLPQTPLGSVIDPFANILPPLIQEATVDGTVAADGKLDLHEGRQLLEGGVTLRSGRFEVASQKFVAADIGGKFPFSLDLSGKGEQKPPAAVSYNKENYPLVLAQLRRAAGAGNVITIGKVSLGAVEFDKVTMTVTAANGLTDITSLNTSLFGGALYGKGYVTMSKNIHYRTDLLVNNASLKAVCSTFPGIAGYITGRVDGVLSLSGQGKGLTAVTGFMDLWAREGSGEKMLVSKEFLQRLAKQKLSGFIFRSDHPYDRAEIKAMLQQGNLTFDILTIENTNFIGVRDLRVSIAPGQNQISFDHLLESIKTAAVRGTATTGRKPSEKPAEKPEAPVTPVTPEFKWEE